MTDTFHSSEPIYLQLAERVKRQIVRGELRLGEKLPSVRDMGIEANVNPNTVQRTYRELEGLKIVESKRGQGTFVTEDEQVLQAIREQMKETEISHFVQGMREMGYSDNEIQAGLESYLTEKGASEQ
ncbi:GntR family transcriptional regulator [Halalkalibacterium halodurans]|jgi:DNA-binding transcriptional regulator YhcF (GntR family)|uniref:Transcriptional regulator (GntR family) n=2 Tax=Halalkalibacterium halodurans TaxID=86665 RepID=Q7AJY7_HALH5|nr:GntR family transcriptional regulator [Halalkalibacterium halodurans]MDY7220878.1 GntR family transcriptional regulator [Halalkalibacterium halodurans]MDY7240117.1 GntR family transcriptional regulator [Halalkalibacterium halodurans]MED4082564.1 GntR family transcriptional regulator [Halalkalibacterium halodurans]MED4085809.1 GntR family transcriptional regulator [Halalkalibacterium halodurans]MED4105675.1 GntR family transcriptional regulator [Halalkalibacterium halodurans]